MMTYYEEEDLNRFPEIGKHRPDLFEKFSAWYQACQEDGALTRREKALIGLAVAHAVQCPYCIDVTFNQLYTITNMPIKRFLDYLRRSGNEERYMRKLCEAFNPRTVDGLMCRTLVSVDWTGRLYDCDFNQMLELGVAPEMPQSIEDFDPAVFASRTIMTGAHCFGCTAGTGSSCGGAVASQ